MDKTFVKSRMIDIFVFGVLFWLMGFIASIILFPFVPKNILGWILCIVFTPITIIITYFRFKKRDLKLFCYFMTGVFWAIIAIILDYIFLYRLFNIVDYYKVDVLIYYLITFLIPLTLGIINNNRKKK